MAFHAHILAGESDESADLAWRKREALQSSCGSARESIGAYYQQPGWSGNTCAASENYSKYCVQHHGEGQQDDHVADQQTARINVIATEVKQSQEYEGSRQ